MPELYFQSLWLIWFVVRYGYFLWLFNKSNMQPELRTDDVYQASHQIIKAQGSIMWRTHSCLVRGSLMHRPTYIICLHDMSPLDPFWIFLLGKLLFSFCVPVHVQSSCVPDNHATTQNLFPPRDTGLILATVPRRSFTGSPSSHTLRRQGLEPGAAWGSASTNQAVTYTLHCSCITLIKGFVFFSLLCIYWK